MEVLGGRIAVAIALVIEAGRVLIARRPEETTLGGLWEFPGGKIEPGETAEAAAVREVQEELGFDVAPVRRLPPTEYAYPHGQVTLTPVLCRRVAGQPRAIYCTAFRWVAVTDLPYYSFPAGNAALLRELPKMPLQNEPEPGRLRGP